MSEILVELPPLQGWTVGVTADRRSDEQAELLRRRGATVFHGPTMSTAYLSDDEDLRAATEAVIAGPPDYLVATTGIGVRAWLEAAQAWGLGPALTAALGDTRVLARGPKAAAAVQAAGLVTWARSPNERMDELVSLLLAEDLSDRRVVVQEYGMSSPELRSAIEGAGAEAVEVPVYRWRMPDDPGPALRLVEAVCAGRVHAVTFTSAPAVHNLFAIAADHGRAEDLRKAFNRDVVAACIGAVCAGGARQEGLDNPLEPPVGRLGLLVRALSEHFEARRRTLVLNGAEVVIQGASLLIDGRAVALPPLEHAVFDALAERPGVVVSRPSLLERGWGSPDADPRPLESTVTRLRRRLGGCGPALHAVRGRGYRLGDPGATSSGPQVRSR
ncbi:MAG: uroporphyrinogen-III synthase [Acidimicrobiales bacterium]